MTGRQCRQAMHFGYSHILAHARTYTHYQATRRPCSSNPYSTWMTHTVACRSLLSNLSVGGYNCYVLF
jgi:hypothetical protein